MPLPPSPQSFVRHAPVPSDSSIPFLSASFEIQPCNPSFISKSCPCTPFKRRRCVPSSSSRSPRRNRHCSHIDCPMVAFQSQIPFDHLPWISIMDSPPEQNDPRDIADLSQLPIDPDVSPSGPGPIRRRKISSRSNPFPTNNQPSPEATFPSPPSNPSQPTLLQSRLLSLRDPTTPPRETIPQHKIRFRNLRPLSPYFD